ncbi:YciI family protein, partial [Paenibacillus sepulcri]|nr:YciI family protein [Paenibacillus sepulcri]
MRFILMTRATRHSEAGVRPSRESIDAMNAYHEELEKAGVLLAAERLYPSSSGLRMSFSRPGGQPSVTSGPLAEVNELVAGFTLIEV